MLHGGEVAAEYESLEDNGINATRAYKLIDEFIQMLKKAPGPSERT